MHRYPGIRSDSVLYTFGYGFKPWTGAPIASANEILRYMGEVIDENDLDAHIRYDHRISAASWSSDNDQWTIEATHTGTGDKLRFTTGFLWMCQGYYRQSKGYTPGRQGMGRFTGRIVHPQTWPDDLDYAGRTVIVIGSGTTAATLVPAIAGECAHVTVLQRSPTYFWTGPNASEVANMLRELDIPDEWVHEIVRRKNLQGGADQRCARPTPHRLRRRDPLPPRLPAVAAADRLCPRRRPVRGDHLGEGLHGDRRDRVVHRERHSAEGGGRADGRHHHHGHRLRSQRARRHRLHHRRPAARVLRHGHLPGDDVHRGTEHGMRLRPFPGQLDPARRPGMRPRVPVVGPHEGAGRHPGDPHAAPGGRRHAHPVVDRPGELQPRLPHAVDGPAPPARRQAGMAAQPGLLDREGTASQRRPRRRRHRRRRVATVRREPRVRPFDRRRRRPGCAGGGANAVRSRRRPDTVPSGWAGPRLRCPPSSPESC